MSRRRGTGGSRAGWVLCFGEALWDVLPRGIFLGGAPLNAAYHLSRHGVPVRLLSAVGNDFLGLEVRRRLQVWELGDSDITTHPRLPTGTVLATLDANGSATYRIERNVAWDRIAANRTLLAKSAPKAIVYGTLALRGSENRRTLQRVLDRWPGTLRVLDLNLRSPFDRGSAISFALKRAGLLKLNDDELKRLTAMSVRSPASIRKAALRCANAHSLAGLCVTAGSSGAGLLWKGAWHWESGRKVEVRDTVGAGDSFLGALVSGLVVRGISPKQALARACRIGEFVATCDGATPPYTART